MTDLPMPTTELQKWADPAMFAAQEQTTNGPRVELLSCTPDPLGTIAAAAHGYTGKFHSSLSDITDEERRFTLADVQKNVLAAPLEFVHLHFRITGVTRGFTHQMVRQRTAVYVQESTRFAVKEKVPVALPPSLAGTVPWSEWWEKCGGELFPILISKINNEQIRIINDYANKTASKEQLWRREWDEAVGDIDGIYNALINSGMPAEDARGLLPTNVLTQLNYSTSLRHLLDHAGVRLCTQAQFEWRLVWTEILRAIREYGKDQFYQRDDRNSAGMVCVSGHHPAGWQFNEIAQLFKPICYKTGKCEFMSSADRYCKIRDRVQDFHEHNIPSDNWGNEPGVAYLDKTYTPAIQDVEWMADPNAARS